ncbi:MAG: peptidoglycan D,D-transpeptidase FtsI family protein [Acidimicrobiia bacterium]
MNRQIRRLGIAFIGLYAVLFAWLNVVQVLKAEEYNENPGNTRSEARDYGKPRGQILSADGAVLAQSVDADNRFGRERQYPEGELFGQVTGYFSFSFGSDGVERSYNAELAGRRASRSLDDLVDLLLDDAKTEDVRLTLSKPVQEAARAALGEQRGSVVAIDPRDGSILALWSWPTYDPNAVSQADQAGARAARELYLLNPDKPLLPRSFRETFFPGSTFKVVTATGGLASGYTLLDPVYPPSNAYVPPTTTSEINNFGGATCGGNLLEILRVSCNTAFAQMGIDIGAERLVDAARGYGFGEAPPLDLPSAVPSPIEGTDFFDRNRALVAQTAIGQNAVRATPLQMALVAAAIANQGRVMTPHVMKEILDDTGRVVETYTPSVWKQALPPTGADTLRAAMAEVVNNGTARNLAVPGVPTAGKTGTAQVGNGTSHAWIIGFAPVDDPKVVVAVIVEGQEGASEATGGRVAAPIGRAVLEAALQVVE